MRVERVHASLRRIARWRPNSHSTSIPATAVVRLWSGDQTSSSQPSNSPLSFPDASPTTRFRNLVVGLASGKLKGELLGWELLVWSPLQSLTTAGAGMLVLWLFGRHLAIRLSDA